MRITKQHVQAKLDIVNGMLGHDTEAIEYNTVGAVQLYGAYGGYAVHRVVTTSGGISDLTSIGTLRETAKFLDGMIAALRITSEVTR